MSHPPPPPRISTGRLGFWLFLGTEVMLFAGILSALVVVRTAAGDSWPRPDAQVGSETEPLMSRTVGLVNTAVLFLAGSAVATAARAVRAGHGGPATFCYGVAVLAGFAFLGVKAVEYQAKIEHGLLPRTADAVMPFGGLWASFYFTLTGLHAAHLLVGLAAAAWLFVLGFAGGLGRRQTVAAANWSLYWHFVDVVWLVLLGTFYFGW